MRVAVIGAGAIGALVAGYLKEKNADVSLVAHPDSLRVIKENGLKISGVRGNHNIKIEASERLNFNPDLAIFATKTQDLKAAIEESRDFLKESMVLTTQNGMQADYIAAEYLPKEKLASSIVMFGSTALEPGKIVHNFEGSWMIGSVFGIMPEEDLVKIAVLLEPVAHTLYTTQITGMKYLKVFVNANNCIPAILGTSMQEAFSDVEISRIAMAIWKEGLGVINSLNIELVSLPDFPLERLTKLASLPLTESAKIYSGIMRNLSKEPLYGSILQSIKRGKSSEIDYINGEFVALAKRNEFTAPLNEKLVEMVHEVENSKKFFSKSELLNRVQGLLN